VDRILAEEVLGGARPRGRNAVVAGDYGFGNVFTGETSAGRGVAGIEDDGGDLVYNEYILAVVYVGGH
jgi:hypothetical protein